MINEVYILSVFYFLKIFMSCHVRKQNDCIILIINILVLVLDLLKCIIVSSVKVCICKPHDLIDLAIQGPVALRAAKFAINRGIEVSGTCITYTHILYSLYW